MHARVVRDLRRPGERPKRSPASRRWMTRRHDHGRAAGEHPGLDRSGRRHARVRGQVPRRDPPSLRAAEQLPEATSEGIDAYDRLEDRIECGLCPSACPVSATSTHTSVRPPSRPRNACSRSRAVPTRTACSSGRMRRSPGGGATRRLERTAACPSDVRPAERIAALRGRPGDEEQLGERVGAGHRPSGRARAPSSARASVSPARGGLTPRAGARRFRLLREPRTGLDRFPPVPPPRRAVDAAVRRADVNHFIRPATSWPLLSLDVLLILGILYHGLNGSGSQFPSAAGSLPIAKGRCGGRSGLSGRSP